MKVDELKKKIKATGLSTYTGLRKRELEILYGKIRDYQTEDKKDPDRYRVVSFGNNTTTLTDDQVDIVTSDMNSHYKIVACAGSGKTTTIIYRIRYLVDNGVKPWEIMLTTFNVDAANSMKKKIKEVFGFKLNVYIGTIDALACRFYNRYFKRDDFIGVSEYCTELLKFLNSEDENKEKLLGKIKYVFFDEFQDCNSVQFDIVRKFAERSYVTVIGDDAQNIYQWRGSNMDYILHFEDHVSKELCDVKIKTLKDNFRSTPEIVRFSNDSIKNNKDQIPKAMIPVNQSINVKPNVNVYSSVLKEAEDVVNRIIMYVRSGVNPDRIAVLSRNNYSIKKVEELLEKHNSNVEKRKIENSDSLHTINIDSLNLALSGKSTKTTKTVKTVKTTKTVKTAKTDKNGKTKVKVRKVKKGRKGDKSGKSSKSIKTQVNQVNQVNNNVMLEDVEVKYVALITDDTRNSSPTVIPDHLTLTTIHKSKGLEWDILFVINCNDNKFPSETTPLKLQEDRRLFYVAVTRAKTHLHLSFVSGGKNGVVTRFIGEINPELYDFPKSKPRYFNYNNERSIKFKNGVTELIEMIEPEDIIKMREFNLIPETYPHTQKMHDKHIMSNYIDKYYLHADYGIYIDRYISRQIGLVIPNSGGLIDSTASRVLCSVKLDSRLYSLYMRYNYNIQRKIDKYADKSYNYIVGKLDYYDGDPLYIVPLREVDIAGLIELVEILIVNARKLQCPPSQLFITTRSYLPHEFTEKYSQSYLEFCSEQSSEKILEHIYNVSLCQNVYEGRRRLLYKNCFSEFNIDKSMYNDINDWIEPYYGKNVETKKFYCDDELSICGELDMIIKNSGEEHIIDFKCSQSDSDIKLEWIVQLLMYAALHYKKYNVMIKTLSIYNPIKGTLTSINTGDWDMHLELLAYMDSIRTRKILESKM